MATNTYITASTGAENRPPMMGMGRPCATTDAPRSLGTRGEATPRAPPSGTTPRASAKLERGGSAPPNDAPREPSAGLDRVASRRENACATGADDRAVRERARTRYATLTLEATALMTREGSQ
mmetsp:Transcript_7659/g.32536  ORF Transcript_7659/g.32536 Transcript_7659/m.32536 type:complete len:123 (-) Transcript_7659:26-394(-)